MAFSGRMRGTDEKSLEWILKQICITTPSEWRLAFLHVMAWGLPFSEETVKAFNETVTIIRRRLEGPLREKGGQYEIKLEEDGRVSIHFNSKKINDAVTVSYSVTPKNEWNWEILFAGEDTLEGPSPTHILFLGLERLYVAIHQPQSQVVISKN